jgi:hypothetical protein
VTQKRPTDDRGIHKKGNDDTIRRPPFFFQSSSTTLRPRRLRVDGFNRRFGNRRLLFQALLRRAHEQKQQTVDYTSPPNGTSPRCTQASLASSVDVTGFVWSVQLPWEEERYENNRHHRTSVQNACIFQKEQS